MLIIAGTKPFFGKLADRMDKRVQIAGGLTLLGLSIGLISFCSLFTQFLLFSLVIGFGMSPSTVATSAYIADIAKKEELGASMGALSSIMDIRHSSGLLLTGIIITAAGYTAGFAMSAFIAIGITVMFVMSVIRSPNSS